MLAAITTLCLAVAPAFAKGPTAATVEGPGIDGRHLVLPEGDYAELGRLTEVTGFWNVFSDRGLADEPPVPPDELGPRYTVRWQMGSDWVTTFAYPFAATPALHLPDEAAAAVTGRARGGWTTADAAVGGVFEAYGADPDAVVASKTQPSESTSTPTAAGVQTKGAAPADSTGWTAYALGGAMLVLLAGSTVLLRRRARAPRAVLRH